jgi:hypothetical protein
VRKLSDRKVSTLPKYGEIPCESTRVVRPFEGPGTPILREYTTVDLVTKKVFGSVGLDLGNDLEDVVRM